VLGGPCQHSGWLLLSRSTCQSCPHCTERLCSGAGAYRALPGSGPWASKVGLSLSSLHSHPGCVEGGCCRTGICSCGLPRALDGLCGQRARPLGQGQPWARTCIWARGGEPQEWRGPSSGRVTCQANTHWGRFGRLPQGCLCCWGWTCSTLLPGRCRCRPVDSQHTSCDCGRPLRTSGCCCRAKHR